jgi:hypothetical protein
MHSIPQRPWTWRKEYHMLDGHVHWALRSIPEPDLGVGDGAPRVVGLILLDSWSTQPDEVMRWVERAINAYQGE